MGAVFEFLFLAFLVAGVAGGVRLLAGDESGESVHLRPEGGGAGGEEDGFLVFPSRLVGGIVKEGAHGEVHVLAVGEFIFRGILISFFWLM